MFENFATPLSLSEVTCIEFIVVLQRLGKKKHCKIDADFVQRLQTSRANFKYILIFSFCLFTYSNLFKCWCNNQVFRKSNKITPEFLFFQIVFEKHSVLSQCKNFIILK